MDTRCQLVHKLSGELLFAPAAPTSASGVSSFGGTLLLDTLPGAAISHRRVADATNCICASSMALLPASSPVE